MNDRFEFNWKVWNSTFRKELAGKNLTLNCVQVDKIIYLLAFKISKYIYLSKDSRFLKKMSLDSYDADIMYTLQLFEILF